ncbi:MAG: amidohydrolase [Myxococcales bacterium]|nr:MAG: amidohydrolase [Myxococcales bacterium]
MSREPGHAEKSAPFDLVIEGGTVIDGTGAPARRADIAVKDGRIAAIAAAGFGDAEAARKIDASGKIVAPGFVDVHTHYDAQLFWDRMLTISPWHGVTSVVVGNCGFGIAPTRPEHRDLILRTLESVEGMSLDALRAGVGEDWPFETFPEFLDSVERRGTAINVAALIGHTPLRLYVMGEEATEREATGEEIARMKALVAEALEAGALGFATSKAPTHVGYAGKPVPSRQASGAEIKEIASALRDADRGVLQATIGIDLLFDELADIARSCGRTVTWTALLADLFGPDGHRGILEQHAAFQAAGVEVVPQVTGRPLMFEYQWKAPFLFESMELFQPVSAADLEGKKKIYADPEFRAALAAGRGGGVIGGRWEDTVIADVPGRPELAERKLADVAAERGVHPAELALDLGLASDLEARFRVPVANRSEDAVAELLRHPSTVLGLSDAGAHASQLCDACFATHLLAHWTRDKGVLTLEQAVRMLTSRSAEVFGITDRGRLEPALAADVVVFDADTVGCSPLERVNDQPAGADRLISRATGIEAVVVNGTLLRERGEDCVDPAGSLPGRLLRGGRAD